MEGVFTPPFFKPLNYISPMRWNGRNYRPSRVMSKGINPPSPRTKPLNYKDLNWVASFFAGPVGGGVGPTPAPVCDLTYEFVYEASISPTGTTKYNFLSLSGDSGLQNAEYVWTLQDFYDYSGNTITSYTGQTTPVGEFRNTGDTLVSLSVIGETIEGDPYTASTTDFSVSVPTTYRMFFTNESNTTMYYTDDFINYSSTTLSDSAGASRIVYSPSLDIYVVGGNNDVQYSNDALSWTSVSLGVSTRLKKMLWIPKLQIFFAAGDRSNYTAISSDGINWTTHGTFSFGDLGVDAYTWDDVNELIILSDQSGDVWSSPDGINWTLTYAFSGQRFCTALSYSGITNIIHSAGDGALVSVDGLNWSGATFINEQINRQTWSGVVLPDGRRVGCGSGQSGGGGFAISDDGFTFTGITAPTGMTNNAFSAIYNEVEDKIIFSDTGTNNLFVSTDKGLTYSPVSGPTNDIRGIAIIYNI